MLFVSYAPMRTLLMPFKTAQINFVAKRGRSKCILSFKVISFSPMITRKMGFLWNFIKVCGKVLILGFLLTEIDEVWRICFHIFVWYTSMETCSIQIKTDTLVDKLRSRWHI